MDKTYEKQRCSELRCIQIQIWQYCGLNVGILGTKSPKKELQTGPFESSWLPNVNLTHSERLHLC